MPTYYSSATPGSAWKCHTAELSMVQMQRMMFRDHAEEDEYTWEKLWSMCTGVGKAARLSTGGQATQVQNLCKRNHEESLKLYRTVLYPVFYQALV